MPVHQYVILLKMKRRSHSATSLFDMTQLTVESLWGHYGDAWTKITLPAYLG